MTTVQYVTAGETRREGGQKVEAKPGDRVCVQRTSFRWGKRVYGRKHSAVCNPGSLSLREAPFAFRFTAALTLKTGNTEGEKI